MIQTARPYHGSSMQIAEPTASRLIAAIQQGGVEALEALLAANPALSNGRIVDERGAQRTPLHIATDWPGHFPRVAATIGVLVRHGADVNAKMAGPHTETPLHWAASSGDLEAMDALLEAGADMEATGAVIGGGTPLADAAAFAQWDCARRLLERGARANLWQAAAMGLLDHIEAAFSSVQPPAPGEVTSAFWCACHGGRRTAAEYLLERGADRDWIGYDHCTPLDAARRGGWGEVAAWLESLNALAVQPINPPNR